MSGALGLCHPTLDFEDRQTTWRRAIKMTRKKLDFRADAYRHVLGFVFHHWRHRPVLVGIIIVL
ncbi:hypothetical protein ACC755_37965, partial [Rhizobium ruizarguesonis]